MSDDREHTIATATVTSEETPYCVRIDAEGHALQVACTPGAMRVLLGYNWPGNVTELRDVLRAALTRRPAGDLRSRSSREMYRFQSP